MPPQLELAPIELWPQWYARKATQLKQGEHVLFCGPTQSGKTLLCRLLARLRNYVVVLGTKAWDPSLDAYIEEGYVRIDHWPPTREDYRKGQKVWEEGNVRFILWPKIRKIEDLRKFRPVFAKCLEQSFTDKGWTIVADEGLWLSDRSGLALGSQLGAIAYGGASAKISLYLCIQRPANLPPVTWTSCSWAEIFHSGRTDDVRELASLGIYEPRAAQAAVRGLRGHQFLDLPCRGGAEWAITQVDLGAI